LRRRNFLATALASTAGLLTVPWAMRRALADASGSDTRFIFIVNRGGWDPLQTLAPVFEGSAITPPPGTTRAVVGGIPFSDAATRPAVRAFFEQWSSRTLLVHGLSVRSVAHDVCERTMLTGAATGEVTDHATRLAVGLPAAALPHLVVSGPVFPGPYSAVATRLGQTGQLAGLIDGSALARSDQPVMPLPTPAGDLVDRLLDRRTRAFVDAGPASRVDWETANARANTLVDLRRDLRLVTDGSFESQISLSVDVLAKGLSRCVTITPPLAWDTHVDSDNQQNALWQVFFVGLQALVAALAARSAPEGDGKSLLDKTIVVALSEMARTPGLNADAGRDHWPWTSAMLIGGGLSGGRALGGYDSGYRGLGIDPADGTVAATLPAPTPADLGATLLSLAGLDPALMGPGTAPIGGVR